MVKLFVLFESATGYAIFKVHAHEEVGTLIDEVQRSIAEIDRFGKVVHLSSYSPFNSASQSLENSRSISQGQLSTDLEEFLKMNVKASKKVQLGVLDPKLASSIHEKLGIFCICNDVVAELIRGIRIHFVKMISGLDKKTSISAQIGLGHNLSRDKIKYNAKKADAMIIQSAPLLEQLDKDINTFCMRIKEWYSYHFPELYPLLKDNTLYTKAVFAIEDRNSLHSSHSDELDELLGIPGIGSKIFEASKTSFGMDLSEIDFLNIKLFCQRVLSLIEYKDSLQKYLNEKMNLIAPNLSSVVGEGIGSKLITRAGSLLNLAKCPASTLQILGAEKALFRALKSRGKTPKYGLIYHSSFLSRTPMQYKGRISRFLAHKCSLASRIDSFSENPCNIIGIKLCEHVEERLRYLQQGEPADSLPRQNSEVMAEAVLALKQHQAQTQLNSEKIKVKKKKSKKSKTEARSVTVK